MVVFLNIVLLLLAISISGVAVGVGTYMLEVIFDDETHGFLPCVMGFCGVIFGCIAAGLIVHAGLPLWALPLLAPLAAVVVTALGTLVSLGVGYGVVHSMRFIVRRSRSAALALREKVRDYRFHRNLDQ